MSIKYIIKKGANLSRCKKVNGKLTSNNVKNPKTFILSKNNYVDCNYDDQINCTFFEFKNKKYGKFIVVSKDVKRVCYV